ncbi:hypothetical protein [Micromonospora sp. AKA38]|uniref:hypothetical protein n=1 Tax=Micromonospora sp. AKA38 TaxID=2733861 RepID=UPI0022C64666|nr:hypothetical protein [Micromonospora sp. AKA38]GHJ18342.1 hypothetical protein TPA0908_63370 [Micromonospora sp. AKA38]
MNGESEARPSGYAKPVIVPDRLEALCGPTQGVVSLPRHLKWSGNSRYDLAQPGRIRDLYRAVLNEATSAEDLATYLDQEMLVRLWPTMWLPLSVRRTWESRFPALRDSRRSAA